MVELDTGHLNAKLEKESPRETIRWTWKTFGTEVAITSSFQTQSVPLLHMVSEEVPQLPILFLDTGFHFPETLQFRDQVVKEFDLNLHVLKTRNGHQHFRRKYGELHRKDPDLCCHLNKVQPLKQALEDYDAWLTGIRRDQASSRQDTPVVAHPSEVATFDVYKICPMVSWMSRDIWQYIHDHNLPEHPLLRKGYLSIGCAPCTQPSASHGDERSGRWNRSQKTECGLHVDELNDKPQE